MSRGTRWIMNSFRHLTRWTLHSLSALLFSLRSPSNNPILAEVLKNAFDYRLQTCSETAEVALFHPLSLTISLFYFSSHIYFLFGTQSSRWKGIQACKRVTSHSQLQIKRSVLGFHCYATVKWPRFAIIAFFSLFSGKAPRWTQTKMTTIGETIPTGWAEKRDERLLTAAQSL